MPAKFETNWMGGEDFTVGFAPRKSIRLRIWGSDVRIVPGAPRNQVLSRNPRWHDPLGLSLG